MVLDCRDGCAPACSREFARSPRPPCRPDRRACGRQLDDAERRRRHAMRWGLEAVVDARMGSPGCGGGPASLDDLVTTYLALVRTMAQACRR
jgi:hypothetical protein